MKPTTGSHILGQINEKMALWPLWPWALVGGGALSAAALSQPNESAAGILLLAATAALTTFLALRDRQRQTVVIMYDLDDDAVAPFQKLTEEFDHIRSVNRIWNVDTAEHTSDWKRNAGVSRLLSRKAANLTYSVPRVVRTNVSVPAIIGGRQNIYFFPDLVVIVQGSRAGALSYEQLEVLWSTTVFVEDGSVPGDAQIVGHTWRFVNKNGGPDRRFSNNRQLPQALYLQMELSSAEGLRKILQFSRVMDHTGFDAALDYLRRVIRKLGLLTAAQPSSPAADILSLPLPTLFVVGDHAKKIETEKPKFWEYKLTAALLRHNLGPVIEQSERLQNGKYAKVLGQVTSPQEALGWCRARMEEVPKLSEDFRTLVNDRLPASWGPAGQPGDVAAIEKVCEGLTDCARKVLLWKETVRFTKLPSAFSDVQSVLSKFPDSLLEQIGRISTELERVFGQANPSGKYNIQLVVTAPDDWSAKFNAALTVATRSTGIS